MQLKFIPLLAAALHLALAAGCQSAPPEAERRDAWVLTLLRAPREIKLREVRLEDVDSGTLYSVGGAPGEPLLLRVKAGRYRFKSVAADFPGDKPPKFVQPERALELHAGAINYVGDVIVGRRRDDYPLMVRPVPQSVIEAAALDPAFYCSKSVLMVLGDQKPKRLRFRGEDGEALPGLTDCGS